MRLILEPPFSTGWDVLRLTPERWTGVFMVKGTFRLQPGQTASPAPEADRMSADIPEPDPRGLYYSTDFAPIKPRMDLLLVATCRPSEPIDTCRVTFGVGSWSKSLAVIGDRSWQDGIPSAPAPFREMKLSYGNAFGGGKALPNIEEPGRLVKSPKDRPEPVGFAPLAPLHVSRARRLGTYDDRWLRERWPWYPADLDWGYFNAAPEDQQLQDPLRGDEFVWFENMHATHRRYESRLPGLRPRLFLSEKDRPWHEIPLRLDTLWVDLDEEKLVLVWRGRETVGSLDLREVDYLYVASESVEGAPRNPEEHRREFMKRTAEEAFPPMPIAADPQEASEESLRELAEAEAELAKVEADLPPGPSTLPEVGAGDVAKASRELRQSVPPEAAEVLGPPATELDLRPDLDETRSDDSGRWSRARVEEAVRKGAEFGRQDLADLDLSGLDLGGARLGNAVLRGANLARCRLVGADLSKAVLSRVDLTGADLTGADLSDADLYGARMGGSKLVNARLDGSSLNGADLTGADLSLCSAEDAGFAEAQLSGVKAVQARALRADFSGANLTAADFSEARLTAASFSGAQARGLIAERADFTRVQAGDGPDFTGARFAGVIAAESTWDAARLDDSDFSGAHLMRADFTGASLRKAVFVRCDLKKARFTEADLTAVVMRECDICKGSFERARLPGARIQSSNLYEAEIWETECREVDFAGSNLRGTKLA